MPRRDRRSSVTRWTIVCLLVCSLASVRVRARTAPLERNRLRLGRPRDEATVRGSKTDGRASAASTADHEGRFVSVTERARAVRDAHASSNANALARHFERWCSEHGLERYLRDTEEYAKRLATFAENAAYVVEHNALYAIGEVSHWVGLNSLAATTRGVQSAARIQTRVTLERRRRDARGDFDRQSGSIQGFLGICER